MALRPLRRTVNEVDGMINRTVADRLSGDLLRYHRRLDRRDDRVSFGRSTDATAAERRSKSRSIPDRRIPVLATSHQPNGGRRPAAVAGTGAD